MHTTSVLHIVMSTNLIGFHSPWKWWQNGKQISQRKIFIHVYTNENMSYFICSNNTFTQTQELSKEKRFSELIGFSWMLNFFLWTLLQMNYKIIHSYPAWKMRPSVHIFLHDWNIMKFQLAFPFAAHTFPSFMKPPHLFGFRSLNWHSIRQKSIFKNKVIKTIQTMIETKVGTHTR